MAVSTKCVTISPWVDDDDELTYAKLARRLHPPFSSCVLQVTHVRPPDLWGVPGIIGSRRLHGLFLETSGGTVVVVVTVRASVPPAEVERVSLEGEG